ncbi:MULTISPECIES: hypothetical protein [unclassified Corynebacterium]|uniref:hypothetical protein n=1 Tax=unclassified Corynebacterium TaxID=2624378 RepID=UPI00163DC01B|nr:MULTISPECIES: hypothetical protein [unclassified Corynebacterium]
MIRTVLIDGQSGSGKTTFATELARRGHTHGWQLVQLDEFYPGWTGLAHGAKLVATDVLAPHNPSYPKWDWHNNTVSTRVPLAADRPMIIEGVGAITAASLAAAKQRGDYISVVLHAPAQLRKKRALARDPYYAPWWDMWARQEEHHCAELEKLTVDYCLSPPQMTGDNYLAQVAKIAAAMGLPST